MLPRAMSGSCEGPLQVGEEKRTGNVKFFGWSVYRCVRFICIGAVCCASCLFVCLFLEECVCAFVCFYVWMLIRMHVYACMLILFEHVYDCRLESVSASSHVRVLCKLLFDFPVGRRLSLHGSPYHCCSCVLTSTTRAHNQNSPFLLMICSA